MSDLPRGVVSTNPFKKDLKRVAKQGKELSKLKEIITSLRNDAFLAARHRDHSLSGNWVNHRECHIENDWLLIYRKTDDILILARTGSHSELFKR